MNTVNLLSTILVFALLQGCNSVSVPNTSNHFGSKPDSNLMENYVVVENSVTLIINQVDKTPWLYTAESEIEAYAFDSSVVVWNEDGISQLKFIQINTVNSESIPINIGIDHDVDQLCIAPLTKYVHDLYVHDGDEYFYHYWLDVDTKQLTEVRKVTTNPEVERCYLTNDKLIFSDKYLGELSLDRDVEKDVIVKPYAIEDIDKKAPKKRLIKPTLETEPVANSGDAADDPAIIISNSTVWILGTNKKRGLAVYDLAGKETHFIPRGRLNNVDVVEISDGHYLVAASNRTEKTIDLFWATPEQSSIEFIKEIPLSLKDPYGLCMNKNHQGVQVIVGDSESKLDYWLIENDFNNSNVDIRAQLVTQFEFSSQTEGCVIDPDTNTVYVGEENKGIWHIDLDIYDRELIETTGDKNLVADVEGMDIYQSENNKYLVVSSQGSDSYVVYQLAPWKEVADFKITANLQKMIDGVSETDGLAVSNVAIPGFPYGILVVQDGRNVAPKQNQNFKIVDWRDVDALIKQ